MLNKIRPFSRKNLIKTKHIAVFSLIFLLIKMHPNFELFIIRGIVSVLEIFFNTVYRR